MLGLVGDIGGTNARFSIARTGAGEIPELTETAILPADKYPNFADALAAYFAGLQSRPPQMEAVFGVASPVAGDEITFTNRNWSFSTTHLRENFGLSGLRVVNDFALLGYALPVLSAADLLPLQGPAWALPAHGVVSIVGPGTGLGVSAVILGEGPPHVLSTEGGHASFAPVDAEEAALLGVLLATYPRISNERLLSGHGMFVLYTALAKHRGEAAPLPDAAAIVAAARDEIPLAAATVERFCLILAAAFGDVALIHGAQAVAIAGGIAQHIMPWLQAPSFRARFEAKGRSAPIMQRIPVAVIDHPTPALLGAARILQSQT